MNVALSYGVAIYTGKDSKIALNQRPAAAKFSCAERRLNGFLLIMLISMFIVCAASCMMKLYFAPYVTIHHVANHPVSLTLTPSR